MATENGVSYYVRFCRADGQPDEFDEITKYT